MFAFQLTVRALHVCPETGQAPQECCLRVSLMPLRLNIDQVQLKTLHILLNRPPFYSLCVFFFAGNQQKVVSFSMQDALFFLKNFFTSLAAEVELFSPPEQEGDNQHAKHSDSLTMFHPCNQLWLFMCFSILRVDEEAFWS